MHKKLNQNRAYSNKIVKIRSATVEPVLGTLINFLNMKKINSRGMAQANKHVLMAALTYNLKKFLKFERKNPCIIVMEMAKQAEMLENLQNWYYQPYRLQFKTTQNFTLKYAKKIRPSVRRPLWESIF